MSYHDYYFSIFSIKYFTLFLIAYIQNGVCDSVYMSIHLSLLSQAPAAFGLVTFLMHAGLERKTIQKHLLVFSAAAPLLAISTYFILSSVRLL